MTANEEMGTPPTSQQSDAVALHPITQSINNEIIRMDIGGNKRHDCIAIKPMMKSQDHLYQMLNLSPLTTLQIPEVS